MKTEVTTLFDVRIEIDDDLSAKCCLGKIECNIQSSVRGTIFQEGKTKFRIIHLSQSVWKYDLGDGWGISNICHNLSKNSEWIWFASSGSIPCLIKCGFLNGKYPPIGKHMEGGVTIIFSIQSKLRSVSVMPSSGISFQFVCPQKTAIVWPLFTVQFGLCKVHISWEYQKVQKGQNVTKQLVLTGYLETKPPTKWSNLEMTKL